MHVCRGEKEWRRKAPGITAQIYEPVAPTISPNYDDISVVVMHVKHVVAELPAIAVVSREIVPTAVVTHGKLDGQSSTGDPQDGNRVEKVAIPRIDANVGRTEHLDLSIMV
jgi:hypothetical protein